MDIIEIIKTVRPFLVAIWRKEMTPREVLPLLKEVIPIAGERCVEESELRSLLEELAAKNETVTSVEKAIRQALLDPNRSPKVKVAD